MKLLPCEYMFEAFSAENFPDLYQPILVASLIAQPIFVHAGRLHAHRLVGRASYLLAPAFVVSSLLLAHHRFSRMTPETFAHEAYALYLPLSMALLFGARYLSNSSSNSSS